MKFITYSLSQQEEIENSADSDEHHQRQHEILLDSSCLDSPQFGAKPIRDICGTIAKEAIDDGQIKVIADNGPEPVCGRTEDMENPVDHALVYELINNILCEPVGRLDKDSVIEFVEVIFIFEERNLQSVFRGRIDVAIDEP